jgi:hypothetical protein
MWWLYVLEGERERERERERLSLSKRAEQKFDMERFSMEKLNIV